MNNSCEFYYDDVTVTSFVNDKYGDAIAESIPQGTAFCYSFSLGKRHCPNTIHSEMRPVYGDKCFTRPAIHVRCKKFACGRESVVLEKKTWPMCCFND